MSKAEAGPMTIWQWLELFCQDEREFWACLTYYCVFLRGRK
jgi:hypothetical protein